MRSKDDALIKRQDIYMYMRDNGAGGEEAIRSVSSQ